MSLFSLNKFATGAGLGLTVVASVLAYNQMAVIGNWIE